MHIEKYPYTFDADAEFPNARRFGLWEGGGAFRAERNGKFFIIINEGTLADFLDPNNPLHREVMDRLVSVLEFESEADRETYIRDKMADIVEREKQRLRWRDRGAGDHATREGF